MVIKVSRNQLKVLKDENKTLRSKSGWYKAYNELIAKICASAIADAIGKEVELTYIAYQDENNY
jgi:hypothetical protein